MFVINNSCPLQNSNSLSPLSFIFPSPYCSTHFSLPPFPTEAFKSPITITYSFPFMPSKSFFYYLVHVHVDTVHLIFIICHCGHINLHDHDIYWVRSYCHHDESVSISLYSVYASCDFFV